MDIKLSRTIVTTAGCSFSSVDPIHSVTEQECVSAATQTLSVTCVDASTQTTEPLHLEMFCNMEASFQNCLTSVKSLEPGFSHLHSPNPNLTSSYVLSTIESDNIGSEEDDLPNTSFYNDKFLNRHNDMSIVFVEHLEKAYCEMFL